MARVTHVKAAQQRYKMVPVLDANGNQVSTPVTRKDGVTAKTTKRGREIVRRQTIADKSQPLPPETCGKCGKTIEVGMPYKWIAPKSGPYGGRRMVRCAACPTWNVWEYSSSLGARTAEIAHDFWNELDSAEDEDGMQDALNNAAERVREIAEEKREGAQNIEDGFGHSTYQSDELNDVADQLDSWADEIEGATIPDYPEGEESPCDECDANGTVENQDFTDAQTNLEEAWIQLRQMVKAWARANFADKSVWEKLALLKNDMRNWQEILDEQDAEIDCEACNGTGTVENDEPTQEQIDDWKSECQSDLSIVDECPV